MKKKSYSQPSRFSKNNLFLLGITFVIIFLADTYQLENADPEREKTLRIMLGLLSPIIIFSSAYATHLRQKGKISNILYYVLLIVTLPSGLISIGFSYIYYSGGILCFYYSVRGILLGILFALVYDWYHKAIREKELKKQQIQSELSSLKYQINPHFLFNTLNNIDSLIKSDPDKASVSVVELSSIMRYMIYDTRCDNVLLTSELEYINAFIELHKMQYANHHLVKFEVKGNATGIRIAPMLFIPFIENTFKHCTDKEKEYAIQIQFDIQEDVIKFESVNICDNQKKINKDRSSGIGLENVKRRLELLYMGKHELQIEQKNNLYSVKLTIELI